MKFIDLKYLDSKFTLSEIQEFPNLIHKKNSNPVVSVILITYNHFNYIQKAIEGILKQKVNFDFEIIIGDDESNDGTREICIEYAKKYPEKIRLILHSRKNAIKVLDKPCGIFQIVYNHLVSRGKYVAICSGDDEWVDCNKLQTQFDALENNHDVAIAYCAWLEQSTTGQTNEYPTKNTRNPESKASTSFYKNIKNLMPVEMLSVIQEDSWTRFILKKIGNSIFCKDLKPVLINTPSSSIMRSIDEHQRGIQNINYAIKLCRAYKKSEYENQAFVVFKQTINSILLNKRYRNDRFRLIWFSFKNTGLLFFSYYLRGHKEY